MAVRRQFSQRRGNPSRTPWPCAQILVGLELAESAPVLDFEPKQINAGVRVFEWSTAGVVARECGVDAEGVTDTRALRSESRE
jgi:hypothetical protein